MNTMTGLKRAVLLGTAIGIMGSTLSLSSCANMNDQDKTVAQGTAIGTAGGAAVGGGLGYGLAKIFGLSDRQAAAFAALGAVAGGAIGYQQGKAWGESVVKQKQEYASTEDYLNDNINQLNNRMVELNAENDRLKSQISTLKSQRAQLAKSQDQAQKQAFNESIASATQEITAKENLIRQDINTGLAALKTGKQEKASPTEIAKLNSSIKTMQGQLSTYSKQKNAIARLTIR